jgi:hypothetical protein
MIHHVVFRTYLITAVLLSSTMVTAFPIQQPFLTTTISRQQRTFFVSSVPVFMSETASSPPDETVVATDATVAATVPTEVHEEIGPIITNDDSTTTTIATTTTELTEEETAAKRKVQRERNTLFVGNLPFGTFIYRWMLFSLFITCVCVFYWILFVCWY